MVYRQISRDTKERALELLGLGWDIEDAVAVLGVSTNSIERWIENRDTIGHVDPPSVLRGRPRILTADVIDALRDLIEETPCLYLDEIQEWLAIYHDLPISLTALHNNLARLGLTRKVVRREAAERDEAARNAWLDDVTTHFSADQIVIIDESSKNGRTMFRRHGRALVGEDPVLRQPLDRGTRYSVIPVLTIDGYIAVRALTS